jgi:hypothetical protein
VRVRVGAVRVRVHPRFVTPLYQHIVHATKPTLAFM